jgi:hypothetical protein
MALAPPPLQRVETNTNETGVVTGVGDGGSGTTAQEPLDFDDIAEQVWPRIQRKLRIERERERGLPS